MTRDYYVNEEKKTVVCVMRELYQDDFGEYFIKVVGKAKCCDKDVFNVKTGKSIAAHRAKIKLQKKKDKRLKDIKGILTKEIEAIDANLEKSAKIQENSKLKLALLV